jgi:osmoprotectant transport system permease protein
VTGWLRDNAGTIASYFGQHVWLATLPLLVALVLAIPLGWLAWRFGWLHTPMVGLTGLLYTIPSLALFVILPAVLGTRILDPVNVVVALTIYTLALLVRTVADGLAAVPRDVIQAATAMGYGGFRRFFAVELPVAVPVIAAGMRVAAVSNVSLVAVSALLGVPQLGLFFTNGLVLDYLPPLVTGIVLCVVLALVLDGLILGLTRLLAPWQRIARGTS